MKSQYTKHLKVRTTRKLKNRSTTTKEGAIGYVKSGDYGYPSFANREMIICTALFPKTRGKFWAPISLCNELAKECVEVLEELDEMPKFINFDNYRYILLN